MNTVKTGTVIILLLSSLLSFSSQYSFGAETLVSVDNTNIFIISQNDTACRLGSAAPVSFNVTVTNPAGEYTIYVENVQPYQYSIETNIQYTYSVVNETSFKVVFHSSTSFTAHIKYLFAHEGTYIFTLAGDSRSDNYGDLQLTTNYTTILEEMKKITRHFTLNSGDILACDGHLTGSHVANATMFKSYWNQLLEYMPVVKVVGNHDVTRANTPKLGEENWLRYFGPLNYSFTLGNTAFIIFDTYADDPNIPNPDLGAKNYINASTISWVQNEIEKYPGKYIIASGHAPPFQIPGYDVPYQDLTLADELVRVLQGNASLTLWGHHHLYYKTSFNGTDWIVDGRAGAELNDDSSLPHGFSVIYIKNGTYEIWPVSWHSGDISVVSSTDINNFTSTDATISVTTTYTDAFPVEIELHMKKGYYRLDNVLYYYQANNSLGTVIIAGVGFNNTSNTAVHVIPLQVDDTSQVDDTNNDTDSSGGAGDTNDDTSFFLKTIDIAGYKIPVWVLIAIGIFLLIIIARR